MSEIPRDVKNGAKYNPAMQIHDYIEAGAYFEKCVRHCMSWGHTREEAEHIERSNIGYWAGYFDNETMARVYKLFQTQHPVFGTKPAPMNLAIEKGIEWGHKAIEENACLVELIKGGLDKDQEGSAKQKP